MIASLACAGCRTPPLDDGGDMGPPVPLAASLGETHSCATFSTGQARCWGDDRDGELGDGANTAAVTRPEPLAQLANVSEIAAGQGFTCALSNGEVFCVGQLSGVSTSASTPIATGAAHVAAGAGFACAILLDQSVECWGDFVLPGAPSTAARGPTAIAGLAHTTAIAAGGN